MRVIDEYVALRVLAGDWPDEIPHDVLGLTYTRHWRLLSAMATPTLGRISRGLAALSGEDRRRRWQPPSVSSRTSTLAIPRTLSARCGSTLKPSAWRSSPWRRQPDASPQTWGPKMSRATVSAAFDCIVGVTDRPAIQ